MNQAGSLLLMICMPQPGQKLEPTHPPSSVNQTLSTDLAAWDPGTRASQRLERQAGFPLCLHVLWVLGKCWLFTNYQSCFYDFPKSKHKRKGSKCIPLGPGWKVDLSCSWGTAWSAALENTTRKHVQEGERLWSRKPDGACCHQRWGARLAWCDRPVHRPRVQETTRENAKDTSSPRSFLLMSLLIHKGPRKEVSPRATGHHVCAHRKLLSHVLHNTSCFMEPQM